MTTHIEHCRPCRREALAAGFSPRPARALQRVAAALVPVPLLRLLRRGASAARGRVVSSASAANAGFGQALSWAGAGRITAAAVAVAAGVGGGLLGQAGPVPAQAGPRDRAGSPPEISRRAVTPRATLVQRPAAPSRPDAAVSRRSRTVPAGRVTHASSRSRAASPPAGLAGPITEAASIQVPSSSAPEVSRPSVNHLGAATESVTEAVRAPVEASSRGSLAAAARRATQSGHSLAGPAVALASAAPKLTSHSPSGL